MEDRGREDHSGCDDHACAVCDLGFSDTPDWVIEVKLARLGRDNGTYEDAAIKKILSLHSEDRSAVTDCDKLAGSSFATDAVRHPACGGGVVPAGDAGVGAVAEAVAGRAGRDLPRPCRWGVAAGESPGGRGRSGAGAGGPAAGRGFSWRGAGC